MGFLKDNIGYIGATGIASAGAVFEMIGAGPGAHFMYVMAICYAITYRKRPG